MSQEAKNPRQEIAKDLRERNDQFSAETLAALKRDVEAKQFQKVVDALIDTGARTGEAPTPEKIDAFVRSLSNGERAGLTEYLEGGIADPKKQSLLDRMNALKSTVTPAARNEVAGESPAQKIVNAIDKGLSRLSGNAQISALAEKFGMKGGVGPAQLEFVREVFVNMAAKIFEGVATSLKNINPAMDISSAIRIPLELRLLGIKDPVHREKYKLAYLNRAKQPGTFVPPTLEEAINPVAQGSANPKEQAPEKQPGAGASAPEKLAGSRDVKLSDGKTYTLTLAGGKLLAKVGDAQREVKLADGTLESVSILQPVGAHKGSVDLKLTDGRALSFSPDELRDAVLKAAPKKPEPLATSDRKANVSLIELTV